ncbi:hypothetical protein ACQ86N_34815 [Puia sp. P3]|uniref:hypothetical protein n=1 Tax=Puia sp. P3 TaxID=3423952 RepID=UPI003D66D23C
MDFLPARVGRHYGKLEQWIFEPGVAEGVFKQYIQEGKVKVVYGHAVVGVTKTGGAISSCSAFAVDGSSGFDIYRL